MSETRLISLMGSHRVFSIVRNSDGVELPYIAKKYRTPEQLNQEYNKLDILKSVKYVSKVVKKLDNYLVFRKISGMDLFEYISVREVSHEEILKIAFKLINIIKEIHDRGVSHGDIKLENIMYDGKEIHLIDFGCDRTSLYAPPEITYGHEEFCEYKTDVWGYGVCLYILVHRIAPFAYIEDILYKEPAYTSVFLKDLIQKCLVKDPAKRASVEEVLAYFT
jgi:serine/threonine protein kinase